MAPPTPPKLLHASKTNCVGPLARTNSFDKDEKNKREGVQSKKFTNSPLRIGCDKDQPHNPGALSMCRRDIIIGLVSSFFPFFFSIHSIAGRCCL
jgi:hypothetical protein